MRTLLFLAFLLLSACATAAQQQHQHMVTSLQGVANERQKCRREMSQHENATALKHAIWLSEGEPPLSYFTNSAHPSDAEIPHIDKMASASLSCDGKANAAIALIHPHFSLIYGDFIAGKRALYMSLLQRQLTYGDFHKKFDELNRLISHAWTQTADQITAQLNQQHFTELEQRRAAIQAFNDNLARQQALAASRRPTTTNCYQIGNQVNCTTW